ncbi:MAG: surface lipoprotein assembly modifier [Burkholderiaceae bacterium]|nr:surface lipoprotein assembly modifier [Burkholderiaceae bacterium]MCD8516992.1 surface lipoprotein assembly modifier [Burkholderiaceae bacterium]MCD8537670.1 surface lipoprotein assembly modifier [Burkholderiaceae bacterium]
MLRICFAGALLLAPLLFSSVSAQTPLLYQKRFEEGVRLMGSNIDAAVSVFRQLYDETGAIRVQLELARSLYLAEDLDGAKAEFIDILQKPIPITVRDKVEWYLNEIQKQQSFKFTIGVFQDSNPGQITSERTFELFGQLFEYQPPTPTETQTALNIGLTAERELGKRTGLYAQANVSTLTYETSAYNKQVIDLSLAKRWEDYNYKDVRLGNQTMFYGGKFLYNMPYVSSTWVFNRPNQDYWGVSGQVGQLDYPDYSYLNGPQAQLRTFYNHNITENLTAFFEVGGDHTDAKERPYDSTGYFGAIGTQIAHSPTSLQLNLKATFSGRQYGATDPLWGKTRRDKGQILYASLIKRDFYVFGLTPVIEFTYQTNSSNINFFSYNKFFVGLYFKNVY